MNTKHIKKMAIAKQLGELLEHACKYSPETPARYGKLEPDTNALAIFTTKIAWMAHRHFNDILTTQDILEVYDYCHNIGYNVGHVLSQGMTGTWGVRLGELDNILEILRIKDFEIAGLGDYITVLDKYEMLIKSVKISSSYISFDGEITNEFGNVEVFPVSYYWNELDKLTIV